MSSKLILVSFCVLLFFSACKKDDDTQKWLPTIMDMEVPGNLKINQLQYLGSHNSYKIKTDQEILDFLLDIAHLLPAEYNPIEMDYTHVPLQEQLTEYGVRQFEIDLFLDQNGGLLYNRKGNAFFDKEEASGIPELLEPGIKVLHIADIDFNSHQLNFIDNLREFKTWSDNYPEHIPIFILLELSEKTINNALPNVGFVIPESWSSLAALQSIETEILSIFDRSELITPDDIRANYTTLNEAVLAHNWPSIDESRGKVMFLLNNANLNSIYTSNAPNLENRLMFTNSTAGSADAAFLTENVNNFQEINSLSEAGYMLRTRVDVGTYQARNNDYSSWIQAIQSGAHFLSTDYYKADERAGDGTWSNYEVAFDNKLYQLNPITGY
jgi:hypothetical protein